MYISIKKSLMPAGIDTRRMIARRKGGVWALLASLQGKTDACALFYSIGVDNAKAVCAQVDTPVDAEIASDRSNSGVLVLIVINPYPALPAIVGTIDTVNAMNSSVGIDGWILPPGRGLAKANFVCCGDMRQPGKGPPSIGRVPETVDIARAATRDPDIALMAGNSLDRNRIARFGQPIGRAGDKGRATVGTDPELTVAIGIEFRWIDAIGGHQCVFRYVGRGDPGRAFISRVGHRGVR